MKINFDYKLWLCFFYICFRMLKIIYFFVYNDIKKICIIGKGIMDKEFYIYRGWCLFDFKVNIYRFKVVI